MATATTTATEPKGPKLVSDNDEVQANAAAADAALQVINDFSRSTRFAWWQLGGAALLIEEQSCWRTYKPDDGGKSYSSFEDFVNRKLQRGRSTIFRAKGLRKELSVLTDEQGTQIPLAKAIWLVKLKKRAGDSKWCNPKWIDAAMSKKISEDQFAELVNEALPGAAKEEEQITIKLKLDKSLAKVVQKVFRMAKLFGETDRDDEALEYICTYFMQGDCEKATYKVSNLDFYEQTPRNKRKVIPTIGERAKTAAARRAINLPEEQPKTDKRTEFDPAKIEGKEESE